ncbi:MAG TPA: DHH family phosphoesterase [Tepidisphaeraceae bacterium]|jgi:nanoRNase/pAp phosphatase (c-di-AMP/oligoRNAs hydrolase)
MSATTAFIESCVQTTAGKAAVAGRGSRGRPRVRKLLKALEGKRNILVTTHQHPDPDALASSLALRALLHTKLKDAKVSMSIKGRIGGGINDAFTRHTQLDLAAWNDATLKRYDAIVLLDVQPTFAYSPLPAGVNPTAVIDHHRTPGRKPQCPFVDIRTDVGATASIIFSYFMELEMPIPPDLAASLMYAIESDLAGAAGTPGSLDNMALSSLTLVADTNKLYQMRYVDLPQSYYQAYYNGLNNALFYGSTTLTTGGSTSTSANDGVVFSFLDNITSLEQPAVIADFLLRFDQVQWALVTAVYDNRMVFSLRTSDPKRSAGKIARRLIRNIGEGGGHRTKAGGFARLENGTPTEIERLRTIMRRRLLRALKIKMSRGQKLVDPREA